MLTFPLFRKNFGTTEVYLTKWSSLAFLRFSHLRAGVMVQGFTVGYKSQVFYGPFPIGLEDLN